MYFKMIFWLVMTTQINRLFPIPLILPKFSRHNTKLFVKNHEYLGCD
jgi:hypothetical protein